MALWWRTAGWGFAGAFALGLGAALLAVAWSAAPPWGSRVLGVCALLGAALVVPRYAEPLSILAAAVSMVGAIAEFWRGRDYFLDKRIRDKALREAAAQTSV